MTTLWVDRSEKPPRYAPTPTYVPTLYGRTFPHLPSNFAVHMRPVLLKRPYSAKSHLKRGVRGPRESNRSLGGQRSKIRDPSRLMLYKNLISCGPFSLEARLHTVPPSTYATMAMWSLFTTAWLYAGLASTTPLTARDYPVEKPLESCPGYRASNVKASLGGLTADLTLAGEACNTFGYDIAHLTLEVSYDTGRTTTH